MPSPPYVLIRPTVDHAFEIANLWISSIKSLCIEDHRNDSSILQAWTENKTVDFLSKAFVDHNLHWVAAENSDGILIGIGLIGVDGLIRAVYVHPNFTDCGVGSTILLALEVKAASIGITTINLESTSTGHPFYLHLGYIDCAPPVHHFGVTAYPMQKNPVERA